MTDQRRSRRGFLAGAGGAVLSSFFGAPLHADPRALAAGLPPLPPGASPADEAERELFLAFLTKLRADAAAAAIPDAVIQAALGGLLPDGNVLDRLDNQAEVVRSTGEYVARLVSEERVAKGREHLARLAAPLARIEAAYGVDRHVLTAIWGVESSYGVAPGSFPVVRSLMTLAFRDARRPDFWRRELIAALRILSAGDITPAAMTGSWAGAMGQTQFMPTSYRTYAVDFDGDGRRDIWGSEIDALASAANYLARAGWQAGAPWGFEVRLPASLADLGRLSAPGFTDRLPGWIAAGVAPVRDAAPAADGVELALLLPAGAAGPAFLVSANFRAILRYNAAVSYALAVGLLAGRIAGSDAALTAPFPADDRGLAKAERIELQRRLATAGFDPGGEDGVLGPRTRLAVRQFQRARGLPEDGHPGSALLGQLRATAPG